MGVRSNKNKHILSHVRAQHTKPPNGHRLSRLFRIVVLSLVRSADGRPAIVTRYNSPLFRNRSNPQPVYPLHALKHLEKFIAPPVLAP